MGKEVFDEKRKREIHKCMSLLRLEEEVVQKEQRQVEVRAIHNGLRLKDICLHSATTPNPSTSR